MSAKYDLYETPDVQNTGEQQPLHARIVPSGTYSKKEFLERVSHSSQTFNYNVIDAVVGIVIDELGTCGQIQTLFSKSGIFYGATPTAFTGISKEKWWYYPIGI